MFETLFKYPRVLSRHQEGSAVEERKRFLIHCAARGAALATLLRIARELLVIAERIQLTIGKAISADEIETAADEWARYQQCRHHAQGQKWPRELFIHTATNWLGFLGYLREPEKHRSPFASQIHDFVCCMRDQCGLSDATIRSRCWYVEKFLDWLMKQNRSLAEMSVQDVDEFLILKGTQGWNRISIATSAKALRSFLRYAEMQRWCAVGLADGIVSPRVFKQEGLPAGPAWEDVRRLLASAAGDQPRDIRDYAILMLFAVYGFRRAEVAGLRLQDIHWERESISVTRTKQRREQEYPLVHSMGQAILRYLQRVRRPRSDCQEIFLSLRPPYRRLSASTLYRVVCSRLSKLDIKSLRRGPHSLRHACAGHLMAEGFSLKEIGDHLGHRSAQATRIYAKVDVTGLREVANFDLGGLV
jgi:integrase/recombinase XerD